MAQDNSASRKRNTQIFGIILIALQIAISLIYGFCGVNTFQYINISSIFLAIALALLIIPGFGLLISYQRRMAWSGPGFAFLITVICLIFYPLINAFWTKVRIQKNPTTLDFSTKDFALLLSNFDIVTGANYSNTITTCFKSALAILAAFSCILGRAGPLECLIVSLIGLVGFELNRQIIAAHANDSFGTLSIFCFGGFMGLALGFILRMRESGDNDCSTQKHPLNTGVESSVARAAFGALIIFLLFPVLAVDLDTHHGINTFNVYVGPLSVLLSMGAALITASITSVLINGHIIARDILHAPIAGAIFGGSASFYATNVGESIIAGFIAGVVQTVIQNIFQKSNSRNGFILSTVSWSLFGVQGFLGGFLSTIYMNIAKSNPLGFVYAAQTVSKNPGFHIINSLISAGIGLAFGVLAGILVRLVSNQNFSSLFSDKSYWHSNDGISVIKENQMDDEPSPQVGRYNNNPTPTPYQDDGLFVVAGDGGDVKDSKAYL